MAIIMVLASMMLRGLASAKSKARACYCRNNVRQIIIGHLMYTHDTGVWPLYGRPVSQFDPKGSKWYDDLNPYLKANWMSVRGVYACPSYQGPTYDALISQIENQDFPNSWGSYAYSVGSAKDTTTWEHLFGLGGDVVPWRHLSSKTKPVPESEVLCPSDMYAGGDSWTQEGGAYDLFLKNLYAYQTKDIRIASSRHYARSNVAFADGHVGFIKISDYTSLDPTKLRPWHRDHEPHEELFLRDH